MDDWTCARVSGCWSAVNGISSSASGGGGAWSWVVEGRVSSSILYDEKFAKDETNPSKQPTTSHGFSIGINRVISFFLLDLEGFPVQSKKTDKLSTQQKNRQRDGKPSN